MDLPALFNKPHYVYRPGQLWRRLAYRRGSWGVEDTEVATLPWGHALECWPTELLGSSVMRTGIYDLPVTEALLRLAGKGDRAVDVGANVGHMTSVLAHAVGATGCVTSYEPHPLVADVLERNLARWRADTTIGELQCRRAAASDQCGIVTLVSDAEFVRNRGTSRVVTPARTMPGGGIVYQLPAVRLDDEISSDIGVLKLDAEGHEAAILQGAAGLLDGGAIRDIVFEEFDTYPTAITVALEEAGFVVFGIRQRLRGPELVNPATAHDLLWDPPNMVATKDVDRVLERFGPRGWHALASPQKTVRRLR